MAKRSNAEIEMMWIDMWEQLYAIVGTHNDYPCVLPDYSVVDVDGCTGWLQDTIYKGANPHIAKGWWKGHPAVIVSCSEETDS